MSNTGKYIEAIQKDENYFSNTASAFVICLVQK